MGWKGGGLCALCARFRDVSRKRRQERQGQRSRFWVRDLFIRLVRERWRQVAQEKFNIDEEDKPDGGGRLAGFASFA